MRVFSKCHCFLKDENETDVFPPPPTALIICSEAPDGGIQSYSPQLFWLHIYLWANGMHLSTFISAFHPSVSKSKWHDPSKLIKFVQLMNWSVWEFLLDLMFTWQFVTFSKEQRIQKLYYKKSHVLCLNNYTCIRSKGTCWRKPNILNHPYESHFLVTFC